VVRSASQPRVPRAAVLASTNRLIDPWMQSPRI
jgi:hypothetical protein